MTRGVQSEIAALVVIVAIILFGLIDCLLPHIKRALHTANRKR